MLEGGGIYYPVKTQFFRRVFFRSRHVFSGFIGKNAGGCLGMLAGWNFLSQRKGIYGSGGCCYTLKVRIQQLAGPIPQKIWWTVGFCHPFFASFWGMDGIRHIWSRWLVDIHNRPRFRAIFLVLSPFLLDNTAFLCISWNQQINLFILVR